MRKNLPGAPRDRHGVLGSSWTCPRKLRQRGWRHPPSPSCQVRSVRGEPSSSGVRSPPRCLALNGLNLPVPENRPHWRVRTPSRFRSRSLKRKGFASAQTGFLPPPAIAHPSHDPPPVMIRFVPVRTVRAPQGVTGIRYLPEWTRRGARGVRGKVPFVCFSDESVPR